VFEGWRWMDVGSWLKTNSVLTQIASYIILDTTSYNMRILQPVVEIICEHSLLTVVGD